MTQTKFFGETMAQGLPLTDEQKQLALGLKADQDAANKVIREAKGLKSIVEPFNSALKHVQDAKELLEMAEGDVQMEQQIEADVLQVAGAVVHLVPLPDSRFLLRQGPLLQLLLVLAV